MTATRSQPRRDWGAAIEKVRGEGECRVCGNPNPQAAHLAGRIHDRKSSYRVLPERVVPLCDGCHKIYDGPASERGQLRLETLLEEAEVTQMVADLGTLGAAWRRLTGEELPDAE